MNRSLYFRGLTLALLLTTAACDKTQPTEPPITSVGSLEFRVTNRAIHAREGELYAFAFDVMVKDPNGVGIPDVPVQLQVSSGPGEVAPTSALSPVKAL